MMKSSMILLPSLEETRGPQVKFPHATNRVVLGWILAIVCPGRHVTSQRLPGPSATRSEGGKNSARSHQTTYRRKAFQCGRVNATIKVMQLSQRQHTNTTYIKI